MSSYTYVDTPNANLVCCICRAPFIDPSTTRTCYHTFCKECITRAINISPQCPIDRCSLSLRDLAPADPVVRNLVDEMIVECPNRAIGCVHTCQRLLLPAHLKDSCSYAEVTCADTTCSKRMLRYELDGHVHAAASDDTTRDSRTDKSEPYGSVSYEGSEGDRPLSGAAPSPPGALLEAENAMLRLRITSLEGVVNVLRQELQAVRRALGPWYGGDQGGMRTMDEVRPERDIAGSPTLPQSYDSPVAQYATEDVLSSPVLNSQLAGPSHSRSASAQESSEARIDDLSSYFPPAEEEDAYSPQFLHSRPQSSGQSSPPRLITTSSSGNPPSITNLASQHMYSLPLQAQSPLHTLPSYPTAYSPPTTFNSLGHPTSVSSFAPPHAYAGPNSAFTPASTAVSVPPLDPTASLPSTLASMHGTIVSLANTLNALASSRAQEALYTGEELRSVRAGMQGLRMQVHDIMTSRFVPNTLSGTAAANGSGPNASESGSIGNNGASGGPAWLGYGPRVFPVPSYPHLPVSSTKL